MNSLLKYFTASAIILKIVLFNNVCAQPLPDSLMLQLKLAATDSIKSGILLQAGEAIEAETPEKSMAYYRQALVLARNATCNECIFLTYINIGNCYIELNKMDSAAIGFENAGSIGRLLKDSLKQGRAAANLGNVYLHKNDRVRAMDYYLQAAKIWENSENKKYLPSLYSNINALLEEQKEHTKAMEYANKAIALSKQLGDTLSLVDGLINLSVSYHNLGQKEKAFQILEQALPLAKKNEDLYQLVTITNNMGDYYIANKNFPAAQISSLEMLAYSKKIGNQYFLSSANLMLAKVYYELKQQDKASVYIADAEKLANEIGERAELNDIYKIRGDIEQAKGNYKSAASYYAKTIELRDSLFEAGTSEKIAEAEAKYQNEKKQKEIVQFEKNTQIQSLNLKQKSTLNYFLIGSLAALLIVGFLVYRNLRNRQQLARQRDQIQQQRIRDLEKDKQLVAVDSMLQGQEEERSRLAKDLHDGLGGLLSGVKFSLTNMKDNFIVTPDNMVVFERSLDMIDTSIRELRRVAHNMMPEMLTKFGLDEALKEYCSTVNATKLLSVKYQSVGMDNRIEKSAEIVIYRIIQELLNNAMKHSEASEVFVQLIKEERRLNVVVEDNGKGFENDLLDNNKRGAGLTSIQSRVDYLKGRLDINSEPGKGTFVNIEFNI